MDTKESWENLLLEIKTNLNKGRKNLFYAVKKATQLYENQEFRDHHDLLHDKSVERWFTKYLFSDYGLNFSILKEIYKQNPNIKNWEEKTVSELYQNLEETAENQTKISRKTKSWKEEALKLQDDLDKANEKIQELQEENNNLKLKIASLEGQLSFVQSSNLVSV